MGETGRFGIFIGGYEVFVDLTAGATSLLISTDGNYVFGFLGAFKERLGAKLRYVDAHGAGTFGWGSTVPAFDAALMCISKRNIEDVGNHTWISEGPGQRPELKEPPEHAAEVAWHTPFPPEHFAAQHWLSAAPGQAPATYFPPEQELEVL